MCFAERGDIMATALRYLIGLPTQVDVGLHRGVLAYWIPSGERNAVHFLVAGELDHEAHRRALIVHGEHLLDELFHANPWHQAPLVDDDKVSQRADVRGIYATCVSIDEQYWYQSVGLITAAEQVCCRATTAFLRQCFPDEGSLKNVMPVFIRQVLIELPPAQLRGLLSSETSGDTRRKLADTALRLGEAAELWFSLAALSPFEQQLLASLVAYADGLMANGPPGPVAIVRGLCRMLGFSDVETDYLIMLGLVSRIDKKGEIA